MIGHSRNLSLNEKVVPSEERFDNLRVMFCCSAVKNYILLFGFTFVWVFAQQAKLLRTVEWFL